MSTATAEQVVDDTVQAAEAVFGDQIEAIFTLGSLAHGGFAPLVSDVDVAIILASTGPRTAQEIEQVQSLVVRKASSPLSARLSLFWADWSGVRSGSGDHYRLGPIDRLDLLQSGRLLRGSDQREPSVRPSHRDLLLMSAEHMLNKFTDGYLEQLTDTDTLVADGVRAATKAILFPVRFVYTLATGRIGLNDASARWYAAEDLPGGALALKALEWRNNGIANADEAVQSLEAELLALHTECLEQYGRDLERLGDSDRAAAVLERNSNLRGASRV